MNKWMKNQYMMVMMMMMLVVVVVVVVALVLVLVLVMLMIGKDYCDDDFKLLKSAGISPIGDLILKIADGCWFEASVFHQQKSQPMWLFRSGEAVIAAMVFDGGDNSRSQGPLSSLYFCLDVCMHDVVLLSKQSLSPS